MSDDNANILLRYTSQLDDITTSYGKIVAALQLNCKELQDALRQQLSIDAEKDQMIAQLTAQLNDAQTTVLRQQKELHLKEAENEELKQQLDEARHTTNIQTDYYIENQLSVDKLQMAKMLNVIAENVPRLATARPAATSAMRRKKLTHTNKNNLNQLSLWEI